MSSIYLLLSLLLALGYGKEVDFCSICDPPGIHTACKFPKPGPGGNCTKYTPAPLTAEEKELLLDIHNRLRSKVARGQGWVVNSTYDAQPKAADMRQLYWDDELELVAQRWVDQCLPFYTQTPHDVCRDSPRFPVGQNIVTSAYSQPMPSDVEARTLDWYNEIKDFNPQWVGRFVQSPNPDPAKQTGHYTQLVWGWTYLLGCGRAIFEEEFEGTRWSVERIVCNYAPGGNFLNYPVYRTGEPCSKCPSGTQCSSKYTGLCALKGDKRSEANSAKETDGGVLIRPAELRSTTEAPVTWEYWAPGKFWVVPLHLSESPEEAQGPFTPVPPQEGTAASSAMPQVVSMTPSPTTSTSPTSTSTSTSTSAPPKQDKPPTDALKEFLFKFTSIPLFNSSKFQSISWVELPKLPPKTLMELLSSSPPLQYLQLQPSQDLSSKFLGSFPIPPAPILLPPEGSGVAASEEFPSLPQPLNSPVPNPAQTSDGQSTSTTPVALSSASSEEQSQSTSSSSQETSSEEHPTPAS